MLGRTANGLFWMYRYLERAENTSRLIETGQRIALTRLGDEAAEWRPVLQSAGVDVAFGEHNEALTKDAAINWMLRAPENSSSVLNSIAEARQNARSVRTALTEDAWEAVNAAYMDAKAALARKVSERDLPKVLRAIRQSTALVRGATLGTMLRNEIFSFVRIGTYLERADSTARILDVKYYVLLPSVRSVGTSIDNVQWETILQSVSARGGFRMEYGNVVSPRDIADFLILDKRMPRSLAFSIGMISDNIDFLVRDHGQRHPSADLIEGLVSKCGDMTIDDIFDHGLHEYLQDFLTRLSELGRQIEVDYRFYQ